MPWGIAAAAVGAAGAVGGSIISSNAADKAASATQAAANTATAEQSREFNIGQANEKPWLTTGASALSQLGKIYGLDTYNLAQPGTPASTSASAANDNATLASIRSGLQSWSQALPGNAEPIIQMIDNGASLQNVSAALNSLRATTTNPQNTAFLDPLIQQASTATQTASLPQGTFTPGTATTGQPGAGPDYSSFYKSPDYQFQMDQALGAVTAQQAKLGLLDSGATQKADIARASNVASGSFNDYANRMAALAGIGQTTATNTANQGANYATQVGNIAQNQANTQANASIYQGQTYGNLTGQLAGLGQNLFPNNYSMMSQVPGYASYNPATGNYTPGAQGFSPDGY